MSTITGSQMALELWGLSGVGIMLQRGDNSGKNVEGTVYNGHTIGHSRGVSAFVAWVVVCETREVRNNILEAVLILFF